MPRSPDGVSDAPLYDLDPEAVLERDPHVLLEPRFLAALHAELLTRGGPDHARRCLLRMGFLHGMQDAMRAQATNRARDGRMPALRMRCRGVPAAGAIEVHGEWPERGEASGRLHAVESRGTGCCALSAGYTSGWLSAMFDADLLAVETGCGADGGASCRFVAREASRWSAADLRGAPADAIPFDAFRALVRARETRRAALEVARGASAPRRDDLEIDRDAACVHIWGPVMVIPFGGADEGLRALELIGFDPEAAEVSVVIVHLAHTVIDEAFGAMALEQIVRSAEAWGAETLFAEPSSLCERVIAELEHPPLLVMKDLEAAVVSAFQIARSQRRVS